MPTGIFIFNLHGIGTPSQEVPASEQRVWVSVRVFQGLLDFVGTRSDVELTFDDANESDFTVALPALQEREMKARFFMVSERIGRPGYLSPRQVQGLVAAGMEIGSHGKRHRPWAGLDKVELQEELVEARSRLEQLTGVSVAEASCPFGSYNRRVVKALRAAGYRKVYTSDGGPAHREAFILPRSSVYRDYNVDSIRALASEGATCATQFWREAKMMLKRWR